MPDISPGRILAARAARQHLTASARGSSDTDYLRILGELAPMRPPSHEFPGTPVLLFDRHEDAAGATPLEVGERVRRARRVFKGRFQGGRVAYVPTDDVPLYLAAYRKDRGLSLAAESVLAALEREGPLHKADIAAASGVKGRELSAELQRLQEGFLVYEEQLETEWDNPWYHLEREQGQWLDQAPDPRDARLEVIRRFARAYVATTAREAKEWSGLPTREVRDYLEALVTAGHLVKATVVGWGERYVVADLPTGPLAAGESSLAILDPGDPLVLAQASHLKAAFPGLPVLKYVYWGGEIRGLVTGRWGINPFDVDDVIVPEEARRGPVREEIIAKLRRHFPLPEQRILRFGGEPLDPLGE